MQLLLGFAFTTLMLLLKSLAVLSIEPVSNTDLRIIETADNLMKSAIDESETIVRNALQDIPSGVAYVVHRENFHRFLQETEDYKSKTGDCQAKRLKYNKNSGAIMQSYLAAGADASAQHKEIRKLLIEHGMQKLRDKYKKLLEKVYGGEYGTPSKDINKVYADYTATHC